MIRTGTKFHSHYADGNPEWKVTSKRAADVWNCEITGCPDYAGVKKVFTTAEIEARIRQEKTFTDLIKSTNSFWANRREGEVLHYHDSFGKFVRGRVQITNGVAAFIPTAMVGNWSPHDLPRRDPAGRPQLGYHAERIINGSEKDSRPWQPHEGTIYEAAASSFGNRHGDPRTMPEIDLTVPDVPPERLEETRLEALRMDIGRVMSEGYRDQRTALETAAKMLRDAGF